MTGPPLNVHLAATSLLSKCGTLKIPREMQVPYWKSGSSPTTSELLSLLNARHKLSTAPLQATIECEHLTNSCEAELLEAVSAMQQSWERVRSHPLPLSVEVVNQLTTLNRSIQHTLTQHNTDTQRQS